MFANWFVNNGRYLLSFFVQLVHISIIFLINKYGGPIFQGPPLRLFTCKG